MLAVGGWRTPNSVHGREVMGSQKGGFMLQCSKKLRLTERSLTFELELPWPPRQLSPNTRGHWATTAKAKKAYRARCGAIARQAGVGVLFATGERLEVHLQFFPPDRRPRDWDNMLASMKAGLDGVADAMGVDDHRWRLSFDVADEPVRGGRVLVAVEAG